MKRALALIVLAIGLVSWTFGQDKDYVMVETIYLKPDMEKMDDLRKGMAAHNEKYHKEGTPYDSYIWYVHTGPHEGHLLWAMGPCTFTDLDDRPAGEDHEKDWKDNVAPYIKKETGLAYWKRDDKLSYNPQIDGSTDKVVWAMFKIKPFEGYRFDEMLKKIQKVYKEKNYPYGYAVYRSQFDLESGYDLVIENMFDKWAFFDRERTFKKDYEEIHGEGSWMKLMEEYKDVVCDVIDELAEFQPEMSGVKE
jgi:hypothetical protein